MSAVATIVVAALAGVGFAAVVGGVYDAIRNALRARRDWEFGNPAPCEHVVRPAPIPPPPQRRDSGVSVKATVRRVKGGILVDTSPGIPKCQCPDPSLDLSRREHWYCLDVCTRCGLPIPLWRPIPEGAFVDGAPGRARSAAWTEAEQAAGWGE